jgi:hypothetical protein
MKIMWDNLLPLLELTHKFSHFNREEEEANTAPNHCNPCNNLLLFSHNKKNIKRIIESN